jgi:ribonuclease P protein component
MVVPKRHAKRSVTRNLLKRQMREVMQDRGASLPPGLWVLRLKAPFDRKQFTSPGSDALRTDARAELEKLLARALSPQAERPTGRAAPRPASKEAASTTTPASPPGACGG